MAQPASAATARLPIEEARLNSGAQSKPAPRLPASKGSLADLTARPSPPEDRSVAALRTLRAADGNWDAPLTHECRALSVETCPTLQGVVAKLRAALLTNESDTRLEPALLSETPLSSFEAVRREVLEGDDFPNESIWMAIVSLEAMIEASEAVRS